MRRLTYIWWPYPCLVGFWSMVFSPPFYVPICKDAMLALLHCLIPDLSSYKKSYPPLTIKHAIAKAWEKPLLLRGCIPMTLMIDEKYPTTSHNISQGVGHVVFLCSPYSTSEQPRPV